MVDDHPLLHQPPHGAEQPAMAFAVEQAVVQNLGATQRRILIQQHGAQHGLLRLIAPGNAAQNVANAAGLRNGGRIERD